MEHDIDVHVIGDGLAGLVAARVLADAGTSVRLHATTSRLGGRAATDVVHGHRFNRGPHAFYRGGEAAAILATLGVRPPGIRPRNPDATAVLGGRWGRAPLGSGPLLRTGLLGTRGKVEMAAALARLATIDASGLATSTAAEWVDASCTDEGARAFLHALIRLTSWVHAPEQLSAEVAVLQLQRGIRPGVIYLDGGWEQIVRALASPRLDVVTGPPVAELPDAPAVVVATGGPGAAAALLGLTPRDLGLDHVVPADVACLDLVLDGSPATTFTLDLDLPGYLADHGRAPAMAPPTGGSVSVAQYLTEGSAPDRTALRALARGAGIDDDRIVHERYLHRMPAVTAIATADSGGLRGRPGVAVGDRPGVFLAGDWVGHRGHLLDAVVASAHEAAHAVLEHLASRPVVR